MFQSEFHKPPTAHEIYWERFWCGNTYMYDPTDDGPECETITRIVASHPLLDPVLYLQIEHSLSDAVTVFVGHRLVGPS